MKHIKYFLFLFLFNESLHSFANSFLKPTKPTNNVIISSQNIHFSWNETILSGQYQLQISLNDNFTSVVLDTIVNQGNCFSSLADNQTYFWRIRLKSSGYVSAWTVSESFTTLNPNGLGSVLVWYDTQDSNLIIGSNVNAWKDKSINANDALQVASNRQPIVQDGGSLISNKKVLKFDGFDDFMEFNSITNIRTGFFIYRHRTGTSADRTPILGDPSLYDFHGSPGTFLFNSDTNAKLRNGQAYVNKSPKNPTILTKDTDFSLLSLVATGDVGAKYITNDRNLGRVWDGDFAEVLLYSDTLNPEKRNQIEDYIRIKYAPPVAIKDSITFGNFCDLITLTAPANYKSYIWSNGSTSNTIQVPANGTYSLKAKDVFGFESTSEFLVYPYRRLKGAAIYMCEGSSLNINLPLPNNYTVLWSTGATTKNITLSSAGLYSVEVKDGLNCIFRDSINIFIDKPIILPTPNVSGNLSVCLNEKLFVNTTTAIDSILWSTGSTEPFISVTSPGNYTVYARTTTGCVLNQSFNIDIAGTAPVANFNYSTICQNSATTFTDSSTAAPGSAITNFRWTFGDGNSTTGSTVNNVYTNLGNYTVGYKITTNQGCSDSISKTISVRRKPTPNFDIRLSCSGIPTAFVDQTVANAASVTNWVWDFNGLGTINGIQNPSFVFPAPGTFNVKLTATNSNGCTDTVTRPAIVSTSPISNFSFDNVCGKTPVSFQFLATVQPPSTITQWLWEFGDGTTENAIRNAQHEYSEPGTYEVTLTARSSDACVGITTKNVKVFDFPVVDFDVSQTQCTGKEIQFTDISVTPDGTPITNWNWFFSGQATSTEQNPRYTFTTQGNYTIQLTAKNEVGCSGTKLRSIAVSAPPIPQFTFSPQNGLPPLTVTYNNQSPVSGNYIWNYGDGSPSVSGYNPPVHVYNTIGSYPIKLIATDFRGCTDTLTKFILVDKAYLDGAMASVSIIPNGEFYQVQVSVINNSNVEITALGLGLQLGSGSIIRENWTGSLLPGKTLVYTFTGEIKISENAIPVVCAIIDNVNNNSLEDRTDNNSTCKEVAVGLFDVLNIYPNPTYETINFGVMLPRDGRVNIRFIDILGQFMYNKDFDGLKGYNNLSMTAMPLNAAVYVAEILYDGQIIRKKFMRKDRK